MSDHSCTEEHLVEQPAIQLFKGLGWSTVSALEEAFGATGTLRRETKGEVVLVSRLTEEELVIFDLLTRPGPDLSAAEREELKKAAPGTGG